MEAPQPCETPQWHLQVASVFAVLHISLSDTTIRSLLSPRCVPSGPTGLPEGFTFTRDVRPSSLALLIQGRRAVASGRLLEECLDHRRLPSDPLGATVSTPVPTESKVVPLRAMKARKEEWRFGSMHSESRHCLEVSSQPHAPADMLCP